MALTVIFRHLDASDAVMTLGVIPLRPEVPLSGQPQHRPR
jgi:hypothetical protein